MVTSWGESGPDRVFESEEEESQSAATNTRDDDDDDSGSSRSRSRSSADRQRSGSALDEAAEQTESPASAVEEAESIQDRFTSGGSSSTDDDRDPTPDRSGSAMDEIAEQTTSPASAVAEAERVRGSFSNVSGREQGFEATGDTDEYYNIKDPDSVNRTLRLNEQEIAQFVESRFLDKNPGFDPEDVRVTRDGRSFGLEFTAEGEQQRRLMDEQDAREFIASKKEEQVGRDVQAEDVVLRATDEGYGGVLRGDVVEEINQAEQQAAEGQIEQRLETQVGRRRARSLGLNPAILGAEGTRQLADLERGRDFTIQQTDGGLTASLTPEFRDAEARRAAERSFEAEYGVDIDPQEDIEFTRNEKGEQVATLTESGVQRIETGDIGQLQSDIPVTSVRAVGFDRFGSALANRRPGEIPVPVGLPGTDMSIPLGGDAEELAYEAEQAYNERVVDPVANAVGDVESVTLTSTTGAGTAVGRGEIPVPVLPTGSPDIRTPISDNLSTFEEAAARGALQFGNLGASAGSTIDAVEFGKAGVEATERGDLGVSVVSGDEPYNTTPFQIEDRGFAQETTETGVEAVESGVRYARENPIEFAGTATGALVGSTVLMGGASSLSRGAGLTSRLAIQPGEEILGYGGARATRALGGERLSRRLFPDNEPLIFSEEAAIRGARAAGARLTGTVSRTRRLARGASGETQGAELPFMTRARVEFARPESSVGEFGGEAPGITGAPSEPLGSPTEGVLDMTTTIEGDGLDQPLPVNVRQVQSEAATDETRRGQAPLYEEIRGAGGVRPYIRGEEVSGPTIYTSDVEGLDAADPRLGGGGPFQVGFGRPASELRVEQEQREAPRDYTNVQEEVQRQNLATRRLLSGEYEGEYDPIGGETSRVSEASRTSIDIESEQEAAGIDARVRTETAVATADALDARLSPAVDSRVAERLGVETDADLDQGFENITDTQTAIESREEIDFDQETGLLQLELEAETESEVDAETEPKSESEREPDRPARTGRMGRSGVAGGMPEGDDLGLSTSWLREMFVDIGTGDPLTPRAAPSQSVLKSQPASARAAGDLPLGIELSGTEEERAAIERTREFFAFEGDSAPQTQDAEFGFNFDLESDATEDDESGGFPDLL